MSGGKLAKDVKKLGKKLEKETAPYNKDNPGPFKGYIEQFFKGTMEIVKKSKLDDAEKEAFLDGFYANIYKQMQKMGLADQLKTLLNWSKEDYQRAIRNK